MDIDNNINHMQPWTIQPMKCPACGKKATHFTAHATEKLECSKCFRQRLKDRFSTIDLNQWPWERFYLALSPRGSMEDRLTALIHFGMFRHEEEVPKLLIENLGYEAGHPLAGFARQMAYEACRWFPDEKQMLKALFRVRHYTSWRQKANIAMAAYGIAPSQARVKSLVHKMASDTSPNVRSHVANMIKDDTSRWTEDLFQTLQRDPNPLVREACLKGMPRRDTREKNQTPSPAPKVVKKKPVYNKVEKAVIRHFDFSKHEEVYDRYLAHIPDLLDKKEYDTTQIKALKQNTQESRVRLLAAVLSSQPLFKTVLSMLPDRVRLLLYLCGRSHYDQDSESLEQKLRQAMEQDPADTPEETPLDEAVKNDPAFFLFKAEESWSYRYYGDGGYEISINEGLLPFVRQLLPEPSAPALVPVPAKKVKERADHLHQAGKTIFEQLPLILGFISQDKLKFGKNSDKILVSSLKKMAAACNINEFYDNGDKELNYLKARLVADFFTCRSAWQAKELEDLPGFIKDAMDRYFTFTDFKTHRTRHTFDYIKHQQEHCDSDSLEKKIRKQLKQVFKQLPKGKWISTYTLARTALYQEIDFNPFADEYEFPDLYISMDANRRHRDRERRDLAWLYKFDTVTLPFVKRMMFLFGSLGMVDLGYSTPSNTIYSQYGKPFLTVFDGLKYVRLTEFGSYVIGRKKKFAAKIAIKSATIEIDDKKTMLSIYGEDPIKRMALETVGRPINKSSYMVDYQSFLQECATPNEVKSRIQFFRDNIVEHPPAVWERFFEEVLARIDPLEPLPSMAVFRVKPDRQLLCLLTTDKVLKQHVIKAENHHMMVEASHFPKVKKRLARFGYFVS
ncbi:MAG: hypothetical protein GY737_09430 [Desulfobacteraceae bacterium]|nr:hypothetical protein [Desulfobacteraceae bacterium]